MFLSGIYIYPVKSLKGISLSGANLEERGLQHDRRWMVVDENNRFISQREHAVLATVSVALETEGLTVSAPGKDSLFIPFASSRGDFVTV